jgi:hypothetical protein
MSKQKVHFAAYLLLDLHGSCFFVCYGIPLESLIANKIYYSWCGTNLV